MTVCRRVPENPEARRSGIRFALGFVRAARDALDKGSLDVAISHVMTARSHLSYVAGACKDADTTAAFDLLCKAILTTRTRVGLAVSAARVPGFIVAEPIVEVLSEAGFAEEIVTLLAARCASAVARRFDVREKT